MEKEEHLENYIEILKLAKKINVTITLKKTRMLDSYRILEVGRLTSTINLELP